MLTHSRSFMSTSYLIAHTVSSHCTSIVRMAKCQTQDLAIDVGIGSNPIPDRRLFFQSKWSITLFCDIITKPLSNQFKYRQCSSQQVRVAERSKAPDSRSGPQMWAWVQIPFLTKVFFFNPGFCKWKITNYFYKNFEQLSHCKTHLNRKLGWPIGLRHHTQDLVHRCRHGFKSHSWQYILFHCFVLTHTLYVVSLAIDFQFFNN